jgi:hypothetical protein
MAEKVDETSVSLPSGLWAKILELASSLGQSPEEIVVAAADHFTILPPERQKAIIIGSSRRRRP